MVAGVGIDIVEIARFRRLLERCEAAFLQRHFTPEELLQCQGAAAPHRRFAQVFAGKEAVLKALRLQWQGGVFWKEIAVLEDRYPRWRVELSGQARRRAEQLKVAKLEVSTAGAREYAVAVAVASLAGAGTQDP